ncbi:hypothetical protein P7K49_009008, partial [Saguinus oedipus]
PHPPEPAAIKVTVTFWSLQNPPVCIYVTSGQLPTCSLEHACLGCPRRCRAQDADPALGPASASTSCFAKRIKLPPHLETQGSPAPLLCPDTVLSEPPP